ncbi:MAG: phosphoglucomutase [Atopobiaceae bacterium]
MRIIRFDNNGWRSRFDDDFNDANVCRIADAAGKVWSSARRGATVYVGYDTRHESEHFAVLAGAVMAAHGLNVIVSDSYLPIPALGWSVARDRRAIGGVMLTASEASCEFGGICLRGSDGGPARDDFQEAVEKSIAALPSSSRGVISRKDLVGPYLSDLATLVDPNVIKQSAPKVVVDSMYGATSEYAGRLLVQLGCTVVQIHEQARDDFGGLHPRPSDPWLDDCEQQVVASGSAMGLALDGDGDRLGVVDERGRFITAHQMVPLLMGHLVRDRHITGRVVATQSSSARIRRQADILGCPFTSVPVGFDRIYREFADGDVMLGAEEYGGVAYPSHLPERDGLLSALYMVELLATSGKTVSQLEEELANSVGAMSYVKRDVRLDVAAIESFRTMLPGLNPQSVAGKTPCAVGHVGGLRLQFDDDSWVLLRPSRTEPMVRVAAEAPTQREASDLVTGAIEATMVDV